MCWKEWNKVTMTTKNRYFLYVSHFAQFFILISSIDSVFFPFLAMFLLFVLISCTSLYSLYFNHSFIFSTCYFVIFSNLISLFSKFHPFTRTDYKNKCWQTPKDQHNCFEDEIENIILTYKKMKYKIKLVD